MEQIEVNELILTRIEQITHDLADLAQSVSQQLAALTLRVEQIEGERPRNVECAKCGYVFMHRSGYIRHPCPPPPDYDFAAP